MNMTDIHRLKNLLDEDEDKRQCISDINDITNEIKDFNYLTFSVAGKTIRIYSHELVLDFCIFLQRVKSKDQDILQRIEDDIKIFCEGIRYDG